MELNVIHNTDSLSGLRLLPDVSLDCIVTLPRPCWMRDYGIGEVMWSYPKHHLFSEKQYIIC